MRLLAVRSLSAISFGRGGCPLLPIVVDNRLFVEHSIIGEPIPVAAFEQDGELFMDDSRGSWP